MDTLLFKKLLEQHLISQTEFENFEKQNKAVAVYWDLSTLLYVGILLFTGGIGIIVYKNINSIGHVAIISLVAAMCVACFAYCFKKSAGYSNKKVEAPNGLFDYILLCGCLLLLTLVGYLQFEYNVFGANWRLATFVPMVLLFMAAYYFDNVGVLSMAITNLAAWAGFTVAPLNVVRDNDFGSESLIYAALLLGLGLLSISFVSIVRKIKVHFAFTYKNFGENILLIALLAALFHFTHIYLLWFLILVIAVVLLLLNALKEKSFYFLVITVLYGYIGLSYVVCVLMWQKGENEGALYLSLIYFIASGIGLIRILIHYNKMLKKDAHL